MVVTDTDEQRLKSVIDAYTEQTYGNWQLCLADACEGEETGEFLRKKYKKEIRLSYKKVTENNGISGNLNASLKLAMGEIMRMFTELLQKQLLALRLFYMNISCLNK